MFTITGPGSPSVLTNMQTSIDHHVEWIGACLVYLRENGMKSIEASVEAEDAWVAHNNEETAKTIRYQCTSWYLGANIPGKPRVFMPYIAGFDVYSKKCAENRGGGIRGVSPGSSRNRASGCRSRAFYELKARATYYPREFGI